MPARPGGRSIAPGRSLARRVLALARFAALLPLIAAGPASAQDEFLLNDDRVNRNQWSPRVALGATGSLVVAWMDGRNVNGDVVDFDTYVMTIRNPQGIGSTVNRRLNDDSPGATQGFPDIAGSPSGTFFCAWEDSRAGNRDIFGATLDSIGLHITPNLKLNDDTTLADQANAQVTAVGTDRYLVVWSDLREGKGEIYGAYLTASGAPIGSNVRFTVDPVVGGSYQGEPAIAARPDGSVLVAWLDGREGGTVFGLTFDVYAQLLNPAGQPVGGNFKVNDTVGFQRNTSVAVAADPTLGYVIGWIDRRGSPGDPGDVYVQRLAPDGAAVGGNVRVNDDSPGRDQRSVRAFAAPGAAYLVWEDLRGNLGLDANVQSSRVPYDASPPGPNLRLNALLPARQGTPAGIWDGRDAMLAAWEDARNGFPDIYAISVLPDGMRRGSETQLNDDAAPSDQRRPRIGRGPGRYLATWADRRSGLTELFGQWITAVGGRDGPNHRIQPYSPEEHAVEAASAVSSVGPALVVAHVTRDSDAGEIRGYRYATPGGGPTSSFWISDELPSAQSTPTVASDTLGFAAVWLDAREGAPRPYAQRLSFAGGRIGVNHRVLVAEPSDPIFAMTLETDPEGGFWLGYAEGIATDQRLWFVHLSAGLVADRVPIEVAPGDPGERATPGLGVGLDGRVEIAWRGVGPDGLGSVRHQAFDKNGVPLGPVRLILPLEPGAIAAPAISVSADRSILTWEAKQDGNWGIWLQALEGGVAPSSGIVRVDQDAVGAAQLDPTTGLDGGGRAIVIWSDARSPSSGTDIVGRVFSFAPTAVIEPPQPEPAPEPVPETPPGFRLGPARPNPFSGGLTVAVETSHAGLPSARARVMNVRGEVVAVLHDGPLAPGTVLRWNGKTGSAPAASGVYWIVVQSGRERRAVRVVQMR